jgi:hypothetical protein
MSTRHSGDVIMEIAVTQRLNASNLGRGVSGEAGALSRHCACGAQVWGGGCEHCKTGAVERKFSRSNIAPDSGQGGVMPDAGKPLDADMRIHMERHFEHDFSAVRLHTGGSTDAAAGAAGAAAYTVGNHVLLGGAVPSLRSSVGQRVLAHELAHVVQNSRGLSAGRLISNPEDGAEREANQAALAVSAGRKARVHATPAAVMQRIPTWAGVLLGVAGASVVAGIGVGIAKAAGAFDKDKPKEPSLDDPKFRAKWEAALQEGYDRLDSKKQRECAFSESGHPTADAENWKESTTNFQSMLGGIGFSPKKGTPFEAVTELFGNLDKWTCDCRLFGEIFLLYAWHKALEDNPDAFNRRFAGLNLNAENTTGLDRERFGSDLGADVDADTWNKAPVGSKVAWHNESEEAKSPWEYEHAIKRSMDRGREPARYAAQGIGTNVTEEEVKKGIAEKAGDYPFLYEITDQVLSQIKQDGVSDDRIKPLTAMKGRRIKTWRAFLNEPEMKQLLSSRINFDLLEKIRTYARNAPSKEDAEVYIKTNIRRNKVEVMK